MKTLEKLQGFVTSARHGKIQKASSRSQSKRHANTLFEESMTYLFGHVAITHSCMMKDALDFGACSVRLTSSKDRLLARFCGLAAVLVLFALSFI